MFEEASKLCQDVSVLRRLSFAASYLNKETPKYWDIVKAFGYMSSGIQPPESKQVELFMQNLEYLDNSAMEVDHILIQQLQQIEGFQGHPLEIVLISANKTCQLRGGTLLLRADRPSFPTIYREMLGTACGTHFRKYCQNNHRGCSFTQHYGFCTKESENEAVYDQDCLDLPYFLSSHMTAFETKMLQKFSGEILLGQLAYRQKCDIYNYTHQYDSGIKKKNPCMKPPTTMLMDTVLSGYVSSDQHSL